MLTIAALTADKSLLRLSAQLANAGKRTMDKLFPRSFNGHLLVTANAHARRGRPSHLTAQVFDGPGAFLGGVHFNLDEASTPTFRPYDALKSKGLQRTADKWAHQNFLELKTYTVLRNSACNDAIHGYTQRITSEATLSNEKARTYAGGRGLETANARRKVEAAAAPRLLHLVHADKLACAGASTVWPTGQHSL
ncbi:hypothetical protein BJ912DRAFT_1070964 [Pholiota molesta]|nr:hypothetical protein BJ912DRAFT_1070964 [Pholiota molesta]